MIEPFIAHCKQPFVSFGTKILHCSTSTSSIPAVLLFLKVAMTLLYSSSLNGLTTDSPTSVVVVVVCPLQPSSSSNPGFPGPEISVPISSPLACPISTHVTDHWADPCNRTGEVHPVDPFNSLDNLKNHFASISFCRNSAVYNVRKGAVIELSFVVSIKGFPRH